MFYSFWTNEGIGQHYVYVKKTVHDELKRRIEIHLPKILNAQHYGIRYFKVLFTAGQSILHAF